jgi:nicotinamidase-related amidase
MEIDHEFSMQHAEVYPLVIIDAVNGCCDIEYERPEWNLHFSKVREMLPRINSFVKQYRAIGGKIIWVKPTPWIETKLPNNINKLYHENDHATFYVHNNVEDYSNFPSEIDIMSKDSVIEKNSYSGFTNPLLSDLLEKDAYLIAGFYADGCVNATIIDGWSRGYFTYILSDLVESMDSQIKQNQKRYLLNHGWPLMYGHVMTGTEYLKLIENMRF